MGWEDKVHGLLGAAKNTFGGGYTHVPKPTGISFDFEGIWSDVYVAVDPETGMQVMSSDPNVGIRISDFPVKPKKNDFIIRRGVQYRIRAFEQDGEGGATLVLEAIKL